MLEVYIEVYACTFECEVVSDKSTVLYSRPGLFTPDKQYWRSTCVAMLLRKAAGYRAKSVGRRISIRETYMLVTVALTIAE